MTKSRARLLVPSGTGHQTPSVCLRADDNSVARFAAAAFFGVRGARDSHVPAAHMARQFIEHNRPILAALDAELGVDFDGFEVYLTVRTGNNVGAVPLVSPTTARTDFGLIIQPRFEWSGIGAMLGSLGWRIVPRLLQLPLLHRSERQVPPWVLSSAVLVRIKALLDALDRRFDLIEEDRSAPRGRVDWGSYAARSLTRANFLRVPCTFPDLRYDRQLKSAIRYSVERQVGSLESQRHHGSHVDQLIEFAGKLRNRVLDVAPVKPSVSHLAVLQRRPMRTAAFREGLQAMEWTVEERGLAGPSDLEGIPWCMPMETFFESWVELVMEKVARTTGGRLYCGRKGETTHPVRWEPPFAASLQSLVPDIQLEWRHITLIVDAKYKRHWEEMAHGDWTGAIDLHEQHRHDFHQVLGYSALVRTPRVATCLAYPCTRKTWDFMRQRGRLVHRASISAGDRAVDVWLTAMPMGVEAAEVAVPLVAELLPRLQAA